MSAPPKKPGGFSLYGDLLEPSNKGSTITGAPVKYEMKSTDADAQAQNAAQKKKDASLKFQPIIKRPQPTGTASRGRGGKAWGGNTSSSGHKFSSSTVDGSGVASSPQQGQHQQGRQQQRSKFQDWLGDEDDDYYFDHRQKGPRGGKKGRNKRKYKEEEQEVDWDAIYDPTRPTVPARYKGSTEQEAERREWKEYLYWHASKKGNRVDKTKPKNGMFAPPAGLNFAPPTGLSFAPPPFDDQKPAAHDPMDVDDEDDYRRSAFKNDQPSLAPPPPTSLPDDPTGEDAYERRMRMSGMQSAQSAPTPPPPVQAVQFHAESSSSTPPAATAPPTTKPRPTREEVLAKIAVMKAKFEATNAANAAKAANALAAAPATPPIEAAAPSPPPAASSDPSTISRAPVRYNTTQAQPSPPPQPAPSSRAPGKKDFGARMMAKMGWEKGQGLGASGEGITTALVAQAQKRKKRSDKDGGGWAAPANMGKIVGGKKKQPPPTSEADDNGAYGAMSPVIKLTGVLEGLDVAYEIEENNLMQEVGEEFGKNYGSIERLFVWREEQGGRGEVFIKFTSQLSALRAVNATDGMTFAGNEVVARFFNEEKFESGEYA